MQTISIATVIDIKEYTSDLRMYTFILTTPRYFDAGSYLQLSLDVVNASELWPESRTFSFANNYSKDGIVRILIRKVGVYTTRIFDELSLGSTCSVKYSFGDMLLPDNSSRAVVCIAGGAGIAPFLSFLEEGKVTGQNAKLTLYYSVFKASEFVDLELIKDCVDGSKIHLYTTEDKVGFAYSRMLTFDEIIKKNNLSLDHFYISGSPSFISFFQQKLSNANAKHIYLDPWC